MLYDRRDFGLLRLAGTYQWLPAAPLKKLSALKTLRREAMFAAGKFMRFALHLFLKANQSANIRYTFFNLTVTCPYNMHGKCNIIINSHMVNQAEILEHGSHITSEIRNFSLTYF